MPDNPCLSGTPLTRLSSSVPPAATIQAAILGEEAPERPEKHDERNKRQPEGQHQECAPQIISVCLPHALRISCGPSGSCPHKPTPL